MRHGRFVWYELNTTDMKAAETFYGAIMGWQCKDSGMPMEYSIIETAGTGIGGIMTLPEEARRTGERPHWKGVVAVPDVDEAARKAEALGGKVRYGPVDIPGGYGRVANLADPFGAIFAIHSIAGDPASGETAHRPGISGFGGWHELYADDIEAAFDFYGGLFGWTKDHVEDTGAMGAYQIFAVDGVQSGGLFKRPPHIPVNCWNYYFNVDGIDAAAERLRAAGVKEMFGPHQVPGGVWIIMAHDPQGAMFSLTSLRK